MVEERAIQGVESEIAPYITIAAGPKAGGVVLVR
jgi:hypothetical protein